LAGCAVGNPVLHSSSPLSGHARLSLEEPTDTGRESAFIDRIELPDGRVVRPDPSDLYDFTLFQKLLTFRPGAYRLYYSCASGKVFDDQSVNAVFERNKSYRLWCSKASRRAVLESVPNNSFKPKPLRGSA
jgi:hypothetical protein